MAPPKTDEFTAKVQIYEKRLHRVSDDIRSIKQALDSVKVDLSTKNLFLAKLNATRSYLNNFNELWEKLETLYIQSNVDDFPSEDDKKLRAEIFDLVFEAEAKRIELESQQSPPHPVHETTSFLESCAIKSSLPKISLPHFSGHIQSWVQFRDTFISLVHTEPSLKPVEKFYHLLSSLSGEALSHISHLKPSDNNYALAWDSLNKAYNNNRVLAYAYLDNILNYKCSKSATTLSNLLGFTTHVADSISAFKSLGLKDPEDVILTFLALRTLDQETRHKFELSQLGKEFPSVIDLVQFVRNGYQALRLSSEKMSDPQPFNSQSSSSAKSSHSKFPNRSSRRYDPSHMSGDYKQPCLPSSSNGSTQKVLIRESKSFSPRPVQKPKAPFYSQNETLHPCPFCQGRHNLLHCQTFAQLQPHSRQEFITQWKGCHNCLRSTHSTKECPSKLSCRYCNQRHHTLLHQFDNLCQPSTQANPQPAETSGCALESTNQTFMVSAHSLEQEQVILGTALILIKDKYKKLHLVRALLDSGSTRSFISQACASRIKLPTSGASHCITGLGGDHTVPILGRVTCKLYSRFDDDISLPVDALILQQITGRLPTCQVPIQVLELFSTYKLADPDFGIPKEIDILLGADVWSFIITGAPQMVRTGLPTVTSTIFGDVISGPCSKSLCPEDVSFFSSSIVEVQQQLQQFWQLEEPKPVARISPKDVYCEQHFLDTYSRTPSGRFVVRLPFNGHPNTGNNLVQAKNRFFLLERRLARNPQLHEEYKTFMSQYEKLGHMSLATNSNPYLIPHHAVVKGKLRVVFYASCSSTTSSLNDQLLSGPKLQADVGDILFRFRFHLVGFVTDIIKMYRQILLHSDDRIYQHILWRSNPNEELREYELNTVTYGIKSSAFQAIRVIKQLAHLEKERFPLASRCMSNDMFVDDIVSGASSVEEARILCQELVACFACGGFALDKWSSNHPEIIPAQEKTSSSPVSIEPTDLPSIKVLGLKWDPALDMFAYSISKPSTIMTKRSVLSTIARIYDPLGFLAPVVLAAKLFLQKLWILKVDWDSILPQPFQNQWLQFISQWNELEQVTIPRYIPYKEAISTALIGFCDASSKAYSAVFYLRTEFSNGEVLVHLLKAKTKVGPTKFHSIARLELCGAYLLAKIFTSLLFEPFQAPSKVYFFSDSAVVLAWLRSPPHLLTTFEANRVSAILETTVLHNWYHVNTKENPADIASRGLKPHEIINADLWWRGAQWLTLPFECWPLIQSTHVFDASSPALVTTLLPKEEPDWLQNFSDFQTLLRTIVRILRCLPSKRRSSPLHSSPITPFELDTALKRCILMVQKASYPRGLKTPELICLSPFPDKDGILRVGGRLVNAPIPRSARHPMIIPRTSRLTALIVDDIHRKNFHAGANLTLSLLRLKYWVPSALRYIKGRIRACVICRRRRPSPRNPIMAALPHSRFEQIRAFLQVGVDYAGPFLLRDSLRRKANTSKCYLCLFICLSTKALHLEAVSSLSTEAFLAALDRFISRRGLPKAIHSDNATNFVGASRYIKDIHRFLHSKAEHIINHLARQGVEWHFIPPLSPHFGGLWEAGVKSVKTLLPSGIGSHPFTFEELSTIFIRIESLLNSRPLCPLNEDPEQLDALTPGHFLIGSSLKALPAEDLTEVPISRLSRWQHVQQRIQQVWDRWRTEYLHTLQQRQKWKSQLENPQVGSLVVLLEKKTDQGNWPLARIVATHPGADGVVRVVSVITASGTVLRRSLSSISILPLPDPPSSS